MADCECLRKEGAIGVAVEIDPPQPQGVEHVGEIVRGRGRRVERSPRAHARAALLHGHLVITPVRLKPPAPDRRRRPGSPEVHQEQITPVHQRIEEVEVPVAAHRGRVARSSFDGDDRAERLSLALATPPALEADGERPRDTALTIQRNVDHAAPRPVDPAVDPPDDGPRPIAGDRRRAPRGCHEHRCARRTRHQHVGQSADTPPSSAGCPLHLLVRSCEGGRSPASRASPRRAGREPPVRRVPRRCPRRRGCRSPPPR